MKSEYLLLKTGPPAALNVARVDRCSAIRQLPGPHAVAVRLRDVGFEDQVIAVALGIDEQLVPMLLRIADGKLARLISGEPADLRVGPVTEAMSA